MIALYMFCVVTQHVCFNICNSVIMLSGVCEWRGGMYAVGQAHVLFSIKYLHIVVIEAEDNPFVRFQAWTRSCVH